MGLNVLGARQTRRVARITELPVVWAVVQSSGDAGRHVWFTTVTHRHGVLDRRTGEWQYDDESCRQWSCRVLFTDTANPDVIRERADELRARRPTQPLPQRAETRDVMMRRVKRADLSTILLLEAINHHGVGAYDALCERFPPRVVRAAIHRDTECGLVDWGVCVERPFLTQRGYVVLKESSTCCRITISMIR